MIETTSPDRSSLALYGGSFDPVHRAHLDVARSALEQLGLNQVVFIPAARSPLKANTAVASDVDRIEMLRLATSDEPRYAVDACEIERGGTSYAIDTVRHFRQRHPGDPLYWIVGADQLELLPKWHRIEEIAALLSFAVLRRPGYSSDVPAIPGLRVVDIDAPLMAHSSSEIRRRLVEGESVADFLPAPVEAFISSQGLYTR